MKKLLLFFAILMLVVGCKQEPNNVINDYKNDPTYKEGEVFEIVSIFEHDHSTQLLLNNRDITEPISVELPTESVSDYKVGDVVILDYIYSSACSDTTEDGECPKTYQAISLSHSYDSLYTNSFSFSHLVSFTPVKIILETSTSDYEERIPAITLSTKEDIENFISQTVNVFVYGDYVGMEYSNERAFHATFFDGEGNITSISDTGNLTVIHSSETTGISTTSYFGYHRNEEDIPEYSDIISKYFNE